jgi:hypothetical protein
MVALLQGVTPLQRQAALASPTSAAPGQVQPTVASGPVSARGLLAAYDGVRTDFLALIKANNDNPWAAPVIARSALLKRWVDRLNEAFTLMAIDTVDAQATYMGHAYVESDQFRKMTESETGRYTENPTQARINKTSLEAQYPEGTEKRALIDPGAAKQWTYIGRGALQVTDKNEYAATLKYLEGQAAARDGAGDKEGSAKIRSAVTAIRADPAQAANPEYAFLFSAAHMKRLGGDVKAGSVPAPAKTFEGHGGESSWETGSKTDPQAATKKKGYTQALAMLKAGADAGADLPAEIEAVISAHDTSSVPAGGPGPQAAEHPAPAAT